MGVWTHQDLVEEVLDKLLLQRSGGEQTVEIGSQELRHEVAGYVSGDSSSVELWLRTCPQAAR
jgi:hypothetical protein